MDKKILSVSDLVPGEIYITIEKNPSYIFEFVNVEEIKKTSYVYLSGKYFNVSGDLLTNFGKYRKASDRECYIFSLSKLAKRYKDDGDTYSII